MANVAPVAAFAATPAAHNGVLGPFVNVQDMPIDMIPLFSRVVNVYSSCLRKAWNKAVTQHDYLPTCEFVDISAYSVETLQNVLDNYRNWLINSRYAKKAKLTFPRHLHMKLVESASYIVYCMIVTSQLTLFPANLLMRFHFRQAIHLNRLLEKIENHEWRCLAREAYQRIVNKDRFLQAR
ncbi:hypothetical protein EDC01DRAFT_627537 [Geopyxis carbonaria]|nr:hypothetical protein EDC01DRAFT_627537 [Geopyxis carbonaria]